MEVLEVESGEGLLYCRASGAWVRPPKEAIGFLL
jgi:hypothetical protein